MIIQTVNNVSEWKNKLPIGPVPVGNLFIPANLIGYLFSFSSLNDVAKMALLSKNFYRCAKNFLDVKIDELVLGKIIGPKEWNRFFGEVEECDPPKEMLTFMKSNCPYHSGKKVFQTSDAVYIPSKISKTSLTICNFENLLFNSNGGQPLQFDHELPEYLEKQKIENSRWIVVIDRIPDSFNKGFKAQKELLKENYAVPSVLEAIVYIAMKYMSKKQASYENVFIRCEEADGQVSDVGYFENNDYSNEFSSFQAVCEVPTEFPSPQCALGALRNF